MHVRKIKPWVVTALILLAVSLFALLPQIFARNLVLGSDYNFHYNRFYDAAMQIKTGHFNYFQSNFGFSQSGRIVNALYGPAFAYLMGGLLLLAGSWLKFQILTGILVYFIAAVGIYRLSRELGASVWFARLFGSLIIFVSWLPMWTQDQIFTGVGMAFIPYVLVYGVRMLNFKGERFWLPFALAMAVLIQTHLFSAILTVVALVPFFISGLRHTSKKLQLFTQTIIAALVALGLSANVWGAMWDVFTSNRLIGPYAVDNLQGNTTVLSFADNFQTQLGLILTVALLGLTVWSIVDQKMARSLRLSLWVAGAFALASSRFLPWNEAARKFPMIRTFIQFPFRLQSIMIVLLLPVIAALLSQWLPQQKAQLQRCVKVGLLAMMVLFAYSPYIHLQDGTQAFLGTSVFYRPAGMQTTTSMAPDRIRAAFRSSDLGKNLHEYNKGTTDYLPTTQTVNLTNPSIYPSLYQQYIDEVMKQSDRYHYTVTANGSLRLTWHQTTAKTRRLPIIVYQHSQTQLNGTTVHLLASRSRIGAPSVTGRAGNNTLVLRYQASRLATLSLWLTPILWIIALVYAGITRWRQHRA